MNYGDESLIGAPADYEINLIEIPTAQWSRSGENLIHTITITLEESIYGFERKFYHISGEKQFEVSISGVTGKSSVKVFSKEGLTNPKNNKTGDLIVKFKIKVPKFTDKQLDMWEDFFMRHNL